MTESSNDNGISGAELNDPEQDACGHAALLLVESVLHGLIEQSVFSVEKAVELIDAAASVKSDLAAELGDSSPVAQRSLSLLRAISSSLQRDHD